MKHLLLAAFLALPLACSTDAPISEPAPGPVADQVITRSVHSVECGCRIDDINKCGNYVSLEGAYLPIAKEGAGAELGAMEWCSTPDSSAEVEGSVIDGRFVATYIKTVAP
jgi:hypothetical protein